MITVTVKLKNDFDSKYDEIEITKEEIFQLACNKAKGMYTEGYYYSIQADQEIKFTLTN